MSDLDTIREKHAKVPSLDPTSFLCDWCEEIWPCETRVVLDALDRALVAAEGLAEADKRHRDAHEMASWYEDREHAARADADRLAEALREVAWEFVANDTETFTDADYACRSCNLLTPHHLEWCKVGEALRQHEAAKEASE